MKIHNKVFRERDAIKPLLVSNINDLLIGSNSYDTHNAPTQEQLMRTTTKRETTSIYFIAGGDLIKIGRSVDAASRIRKLRASSPYPLKVLCINHNVRPCIEVYLHTKFAKFRRHGEWFADVPEIRAEIDLILKRRAPYMRKKFKFVPNWHLADPQVAAALAERAAMSEEERVDKYLMSCVG